MLILLVAALLAQASPEAVDWESMIPTIRSLLQNEFLGIEERFPIGIRATADVTGDGRTEALVDLGASGASTDRFTVMRMEEGRPVVARFRQKDGTISTLTFIEGASVRHGDATDFLAQEQGISATHYKMDSSGAKFESCGAEVYKWNPDTKTFNFNSRLSEKVGRDYCRKLAQRTR